MRIGIDCRKFYDIHQNKGAGVERYTYHLVKNLLLEDKENEYVLFFSSSISPETIHKVKGNNPRIKIVKVFQGQSRIPLWDNHWQFARVLAKEKLDRCIFPANIIPLFYRGHSTLIIHDLAIYLHPEWFPERQWFSVKFLVPYSLKKAKSIVAISHNTKSDLIKLFKVKQEKVRVIYPGVIVKTGYLPEEEGKVVKKYDISGRYVFFVGTIEPRKNILNLIKAFSNYLFENEESDVSLVLAGIKGWKFKPIFRQLNEINQRMVGSRIKYLGKISNRERNILLKGASAFAFPSHYEGFGFPIVEAMALGVPVVAGDNSSLKEIAGDAAVLVDSHEVNDIRRGIKKVVEDVMIRDRLISKGFEKSKQFSWRKTAKQFLIVLK